jgi:predicted nucleotidyltransferase component of viral defense system
MIDTIKSVLSDAQDASNIFKRTLVKEYIQVLSLSFLYTHKQYSNLIFYGGSSLRHCFELPRLSEDLDFVDIGKNINTARLYEDVCEFFKKKYDMSVTGRYQKFRCILKFPLLHDLEIAGSEESDLLFMKIEVYNDFGFCSEYNTQIIPVFKFGQSLLIKTFDLPTLMATKIDAVLHRKWERTSKNGETLAKVKGRDYFDLLWYLRKGIRPNINCIRGVSDESNTYEQLFRLIQTVDVQSIKYDLQGLIQDQGYIETLTDNIKEILKNLIEERM